MASGKGRARGRRRTAQAVHLAAVRAVERVLSSEESFALLIRRLEAAGWRIERPTPPAMTSDPLTPPARAR